MKAVILCTLLLNLPTSPEHSEAMATCLVIAHTAEAHGESMPVLLSLAWHESRLRWSAKSRVGAVGPLQVIPRFWMVSEPCEVAAGVQAFRFWRSKSMGMVEAVAKYNAGHKPKPRAFIFANRVVALAEALNTEATQ